MTRALSTALFCVLALCSIGCDEGELDDDAGAAGFAGTMPPRTPEQDAGRAAPDHDADEPDDVDAGAPMTCGPQGECDLRSVDGCGDGMSCVLLRGGALVGDDAGSEALDEDGGAARASLAPMCVAAGVGRDGDACDGLRSCGPGLDCTAGEDGVCRRYCCDLNTTAGCPRGQFCRVELMDELGASTGAALCDACDDCAVLGADCPEGQGCYPLAASTGMCNACLPKGEHAPEASCRFSNDCAPGSACVELSGERRCAELCKTGEDSCESDRACAAVSDEPFGAGVGLCTAAAEP